MSWKEKPLDNEIETGYIARDRAYMPSPWKEKPLDNEIETKRQRMRDGFKLTWKEKPLDNEIETEQRRNVVGGVIDLKRKASR